MPLSNYLPSFVSRLFTNTSQVQGPGPEAPPHVERPVQAVIRDSIQRGPAQRQAPTVGSGQEAQLRAPERAPRIQPASSGAPDFYPALEDLLAIKAAERGTTMRGIELRFYDPRGIIAAYALDPSREGTSCKDLFSHILRTKNFGPSCGETSNALKSVLFSGATREQEGEQALYEAIRAPGDGFLRVQIGCHSFVVEKKDDACRIFQSYDGWYSMATSLKDDKPIAKETFAALIQQVVRKDQARTQGEYDAAQLAEERLFHGEVDATRNAKGTSRYQIVTESAERRTPTSELGGRMDALLNRYNNVWEAFENDSRTSVGDFARAQWPELFGL
ncbi:MAG: hypothetical protein HOI23_00285 [Deltaproteobacteria bacterium]|jgi:hypothetical protein|nr:hypothetical protein [Deltaproteobacteria bacterium]MBT6435971.1 hypothetical protein [Deltaproteobacteria bacterium]MBT6489814.1 hypothetical protein [Deltaproteobacteria bacterium]